MEVEDDVQLAHVAVVLVHLLDVSVHDFEGDQLVVIGSASGDEEQGGIATVNDFGIWRGGELSVDCGRRKKQVQDRVQQRLPEAQRWRGRPTLILKEIAHPRATGQNELGHILDDLGLLLGGESSEPFGKALKQNYLVSSSEPECG